MTLSDSSFRKRCKKVLHTHFYNGVILLDLKMFQFQKMELQVKLKSFKFNFKATSSQVNCYQSIRTESPWDSNYARIKLR